jgi:SAM-dependent methyltransferase
MGCMICGSDMLESIPFDRIAAADGVLARRGLAAAYEWRLCMRCGNATPASAADPAALEEIWQSNRQTPGDQNAQWAYRRRIAEIGARRSWDVFSGLRKGAGQGRFLDIACGHGMAVKLFKDSGWHAEGSDIDATMKPFHDELGITTRIGPVENEAWDEPFDLIQIAYAIYFITDPKAYLARLRGLLKPDGHLALVIADHLAYTCESGPNYAHTFIPTAQSLAYLLNLAGYDVVLTRKIKDTTYLAARPGGSTPPVIDTKAILRAHRTRALRWRLIGANRARLRALVARLTGR